MREKEDLYLYRRVFEEAPRLLSRDQRTKLVDAVIFPIQIEQIDLVLKRGKEAIKRFIDIFDRLGYPQSGPIDSATFAALYVTDTAVDVFRSPSLIAKERENFPLFFLFFDADFGASMVAGDLLKVSPSLRQPNAASIVSNSGADFDAFFGTSLSSVGEQAETYLRVLVQHSKAQNLLDVDKTGSKLILQSAFSYMGLPSSLGESGIIPKSFVPEFVAAGAKFAQALYEAVYPWAEKISSYYPKARL